ncbi:MAG: AAA family ATPase [Planctomycetota bacterium]
MNSQDEVILLTSNRTTADSVLRALEGDDRLVVTNQFDDLSDFANHLEAKSVSAAVVDVDPDPTEMLHNLAPVVSKFPRTCFVVLSEQWDENLVLEAMEIGVRRFMRKESAEQELSRVFRRLLPKISPVEPTVGRIITILSAGGGCGATTLAVNMANELRLAQTASVLLVDMDTAYGSVAASLNLSAGYGLSDILAQSESVDVDLVRSTSTPYAEGLDVLLSPVAVNPINPADLSFDHLGKVVETFRKAYQHTIIDAPRVPLASAAALADVSHATFIVMQLTVKDIRTAQRVRAALIERGVSPDRILPVIGRYSKKDSSVGLDEVKRVLDSSNIALVSNDFYHAARSIDLGEPLARTAARSALRKDIQKLLEMVPATRD